MKTSTRKLINTLRKKKRLTTDQIRNMVGTQQNARILEARDYLGCKCKRGNLEVCTAKEHIICAKNREYIYRNN